MPRARRIALLFAAHNNYFQELLRGLTRYAQRHGPWEVGAMTFGDVRVADLERGRGFDGVVVDMLHDLRLARRACRGGLPAVDVTPDFMDARSPNGRAQLRLGLPQVLPDHVAVGRAAARHLLDLGLRQFAGCGYAQNYWRERFSGFAQVLGDAGHPVHEFDHGGRAWGAAGVRTDARDIPRWLSRLPRPLGVLAANDQRARDVVVACRRLGLAVPGDVAIVGVDDHPVCEMTFPSITSIPLDAERAGYQAGALLDRLIDGHAPPPRPIRVAPGPLIVRRSTQTVAFADPDVAAAMGFVQAHPQVTRVDEVVAAVGGSRRTLQLKVRRELGRTLQAVLLERRFERAKALLTESDMPVARVARACGFRRPEHFSTAFAKHTSVPPLRYRRQTALT